MDSVTKKTKIMMNLEDLKKFCLSLNGTEEKMPFDNKTLVFTVKGKMFCLTDITKFITLMY